jgi:hypothetical protein
MLGIHGTVCTACKRPTINTTTWEASEFDLEYCSISASVFGVVPRTISFLRLPLACLHRTPSYIAPQIGAEQVWRAGFRRHVWLELVVVISHRLGPAPQLLPLGGTATCTLTLSWYAGKASQITSVIARDGDSRPRLRPNLYLSSSDARDVRLPKDHVVSFHAWHASVGRSDREE